MSERRRRIAIVGCGPLGRLVAETYSRAGRGVVVIDRDATALSRLAPDFSGLTICADAEQLGVLARAELGSQSTLMALTGDDDLNYFVAVAARSVFSVEDVVARIEDPAKARLCLELEIDTVRAFALAARELTEGV